MRTLLLLLCSWIYAASGATPVPSTSSPAPWPPQAQPGRVTAGYVPSALTWTAQTIRQNTISPIDQNFLTFDCDMTNPSASMLGGGSISGGAWTPAAGTDAIGAPKFKIPHFAVCVDVASDSSASWTCGVVDGSSHYASISKISSTSVQIAAWWGNTSNVTVPTLTAPYSFALQVSHTSVSGWVKQGGVWKCYVRTVNSATGTLDYRTPAGLAAIHPYVYFGSGTLTVSRVYAGYAGSVGIANQSFLVFDDGTPITQGNKAYFVSNSNTAAGSTTSDFATNLTACCCSIFEFDLDTYAYRCVSKLCFTHADGTLWGENSGCITYDRGTGLWNLVISNNDFGGTSRIQLFLYQTAENILSGVHALPLGTLMGNANGLPTNQAGFTGAVNSYDPSLVKIGGLWNLSYACPAYGWTGVAQSFTHLATSPVLTPSATWTLAAADLTTSGYYEGTQLVRINGLWYVMTCGAGALKIYPVAGISGQAFATSYTSTPAVSFTYANNHANMYPLYRGGKTYLLWVGWNNTAYQSYTLSWGELVVQLSNQAVTGREFGEYLAPSPASIPYGQ